MGKSGYTIEQIAEWFLGKSNMTHKKVQKLCYYAVAWGYALYDKPIVSNPSFEAWVHGPVSPDLYHKYAGNGWNDLEQEEKIDINDAGLEELLESVWVTYGGETGNSLEALAHTEAPWIFARGGCDAEQRCSNPIDPDQMKEYYRSIYSGGEGIGE